MLSLWEIWLENLKKKTFLLWDRFSKFKVHHKEKWISWDDGFPRGKPPIFQSSRTTPSGSKSGLKFFLVDFFTLSANNFCPIRDELFLKPAQRPRVYFESNGIRWQAIRLKTKKYSGNRHILWTNFDLTKKHAKTGKQRFSKTAVKKNPEFCREFFGKQKDAQ
jgi:hypothetical protein